MSAESEAQAPQEGGKKQDSPQENEGVAASDMAEVARSGNSQSPTPSSGREGGSGRNPQFVAPKSYLQPALPPMQGRGESRGKEKEQEGLSSVDRKQYAGLVSQIHHIYEH